jgi:hypothetical protein
MCAAVRYGHATGDYHVARAIYEGRGIPIGWDIQPDEGNNATLIDPEGRAYTALGKVRPPKKNADRMTGSPQGDLGIDRLQRNPDEDLRDLERRSRQGDVSAKKRLSVERRRRGVSDVPDYEWAEAEIARVAVEFERENPDNFRVARSDNEDELLSFEAQRDKGCCGSHEWEATDPEGTRWVLGFNFGH